MTNNVAEEFSVAYEMAKNAIPSCRACALSSLLRSQSAVGTRNEKYFLTAAVGRLPIRRDDSLESLVSLTATVMNYAISLDTTLIIKRRASKGTPITYLCVPYILFGNLSQYFD